MKAIVFAYHNFGVRGLDALIQHGFKVVAVFSHADDPAENCWFDSVVTWAKKRTIPVYCPDNVNTQKWTALIAKLTPDIIFSFYYRKLLCPSILNLAPVGAFNLHASLLPKYRGRVPVNWALICGEKETGVTLHYMLDRADAGDIVGQKKVRIDFSDTVLTLYAKLLVAAVSLLNELLPEIAAGCPRSVPQTESLATIFYARKPIDGLINWQWPAKRIYNLIRALTKPYPGAFTYLPSGEKMYIWSALPVKNIKTCKMLNIAFFIWIQGESIFVRTSDGFIQLLEIQLAGIQYREKDLYDYFINQLLENNNGQY